MFLLSQQHLRNICIQTHLFRLPDDFQMFMVSIISKSKVTQFYKSCLCICSKATDLTNFNSYKIQSKLYNTFLMKFYLLLCVSFHPSKHCDSRKFRIQVVMLPNNADIQRETEREKIVETFRLFILQSDSKSSSKFELIPSQCVDRFLRNKDKFLLSSKIPDM